MQLSVKLKKGVKLCFINEPGELLFIKVLADGKVLVEDENGFELAIDPCELMTKTGQRLRSKEFIFKEQASNAKLRLPLSVNKISPNCLELDLHIESLCDWQEAKRIKHPLSFQLNALQSTLLAARKDKIQYIIVITGKGEGILRKEILNLLHSKDDLEVYDASFDKYGGGALEVKLYNLHR